MLTVLIPAGMFGSLAAAQTGDDQVVVGIIAFFAGWVLGAVSVYVIDRMAKGRRERAYAEWVQQGSPERRGSPRPAKSD